MKTRKLRRKNLKSKSRRNKKYGGQPKIQHRPIEETQEATVDILMLDYEKDFIKDIFDDDNTILPYSTYDTSERMHNLPEYNDKTKFLRLKKYWNDISREVGLRLFIFYGTLPAFRRKNDLNELILTELFRDKIAAMVASDIKPLVCILLGCRTSEIAYALNQAHNIADRCYFIGINETFQHHKYDKTSILCPNGSKIKIPIKKLEDIYGARENFMEEFIARDCKMLKRDNVVQFLMEIKPITNGPQISKAGKVIKNTGVLGRDKSYFSSSRLATITDVSDFKDPDYERRYKIWLDKMLIRHIVYDNGDIYDGYAYWGIDEDRMDTEEEDQDSDDPDEPRAPHVSAPREIWHKTGQGTMRYANGNVYTGNWGNDTRDGNGTMTYANGDVFKGEWRVNPGIGIMNFANGDEFEGNLRGSGIMRYANGDEYEGEWAGAFKKGIMRYTNGDVYNGKWYHNNKNYEGIMNYSNGDVYSGNWRIDKRERKGTMRYANGDVYEGNWHEDKREGYGKMRYANGDVYEGNWHDDKREGRGKITYNDGRVYDGNWHEDQLTKGKMLDSSGRSIKVTGV